MDRSPISPHPERTLVREHISFSQISMWQRCSLQYYYRYIEGWKERPSLNLARGKAGHAAVEHNLKSKMKTGEDVPIDVMLDVFSQEYDHELSGFEDTDLMPGENIGKTKDDTVKVLATYRHEEAPLMIPKMVEAEFSIEVPAPEDGHPIRPVIGRMDLIGDRDPSLAAEYGINLDILDPINQTRFSAVIDHKFVTRLSKTQADIDLSDQLTLYDMVMAKSGLPTDRLGFELFIPPLKTQKARIVQLLRDPNMMTPEVRQQRHDRLIYKIQTIERAIAYGIFVPTDDPKVCGWCGYKDRCQKSLVKDDYDALALRQIINK